MEEIGIKEGAVMEIGPIKPDGFSAHESANRRSQKEQDNETIHLPDALTESTEKGDREYCSETDVEEISRTNPDRLLLIRQRMETGFYDQLRVKEKMIDRMIDEMLKNISEFYK